MVKAKRFNGIDFNSVDSLQVQRLVKDLYASTHHEKRDFQTVQLLDRRQGERRITDKFVLLDTRANRSRRHSHGRRQHDDKPDNGHKVGIDYYI